MTCFIVPILKVVTGATNDAFSHQTHMPPKSIPYFERLLINVYERMTIHDCILGSSPIGIISPEPEFISRAARSGYIQQLDCRQMGFHFFKARLYIFVRCCSSECVCLNSCSTHKALFLYK